MASSTIINSNAFNFMKLIQSQVDPRTGQYTCAISLPELKANNLCGPVVPLQLNFNPLNARDSGFGKGWNLQLSQFDPNKRVLSLYTGETFKVDLGGGEPFIPEKKVDSFHFHDLGSRRYRVEHKSGLVEILAVQQGELALPVQMLSPQGHSVTFWYDTFGTDPLLSSILNGDGTPLLSLKRTTNELQLKLHPGSAFEALFVMHIRDNETRSIVLPTEDQASWRFSYVQQSGLTCLEHVYTPTGGHETVTYSGTPHAFPGLPITTRSLPRVKSHVRDPGFDLAPIEMQYEYDKDGYNFLGNSSGQVWDDNGLDNLYKAPYDYQYTTNEQLWDALTDKAVRETKRVFNRFHLLVREETIQYSADPAKDDTVMLSEIEYYIDPHADFKDQPNYCQLPKTVSRTWHNSRTTLPRHVEVVTTTYDDWGNLLTQVNANGVTETSEWYKAEGQDGCPADPQGFVRSLKSKTVTPATSRYGKAPTLQTFCRYSKQPGLTGHGPWVALQDEILSQWLDGRAQVELRHIAHEYKNDPADPMQHGLLCKVLQTLHGRSETLTTTAYSYDYARHARTNAKVLRTVSTLIGHDDTPKEPMRKSIIQEHNLYNGAKWLRKDDNDSEVAYEYDLLGRVTRVIAAPNSDDYKASCTYTYRLTNGLPDQMATQTVTDVKGVETIAYLDGHNRVIKTTRRDADALGGDSEAFRETYRAKYNHFDQLVSETTVDWEGKQDVILTNTFEYDAWGEQYKVIGADGVARVTENQPDRQTVLTWTESTEGPLVINGKSRTRLNFFGKEDLIESLDATGKVLSENQYLYDGLGHCVEQINAMGESTRFAYDLFSRLQTTTLPDYSQIHRAYAPHSAGELPIGLEVFDGEKSINVGNQTFDGLGRRTTLEVGPRLQQFMYERGSQQISKMVTASNRTITYEYTPGLVGTPVSSAAPDEQSSFIYDKQSAQLNLSQNTQGEHRFDYNYNGQLRSESWKETRSGKLWETVFTHTLSGRPLTRLNTRGLVCTYTYDNKARIKSVTQGQLVANFDYDTLGRVHVITTRNDNANQKLVTTLTFDDQGREVTRQMALENFPAQTISQTYRADGKLQTRHLTVGEDTELLETFVYDQRGRMVRYYCEGSNPPKDRYGNPITEQVFVFDALDNVTALYTWFVDGSDDESLSSFSENDPCQLKKVSHSHAAYPVSVEFDYDEDGNLLHDELGQTLNYDSQGRLLSVSGADGTTVSQYRYDAHNHLLGVAHGAQPETLRFYQDDRLSRTEQGDKKIHYLYVNELPLGQQQQDKPDSTLLLLADGKNSVLAESGQNTLRKAVYGAYGERNPDDDLQCLLGFNGEVRDELCGWYLLGRGYRAYNPTLMRFHSPDSLSPFGAGGINPYVYCAGDPINSVDPTGHYERGVNWTGIQGILLTVAAVGLSGGAAILVAPTTMLGIAFTVGMEALGLAFSAITIDQGIKATTAVKAEDREKNATSALVGGAIDAALNTLFFLIALRTYLKATQTAANEAARASWFAQIDAGIEDALGTLKANTAKRSSFGSGVEDGGGALSDAGSRRSSQSGGTPTPSPHASPTPGPSRLTRQQSAGNTWEPEIPPPDYSPVSTPTPPRKPRNTGGIVVPDGKWSEAIVDPTSKLNDKSVSSPPARTVSDLRKAIGNLEMRRPV
jgi:RHS repeat-associated protein